MIIADDTPRCQRWIAEHFGKLGTDLTACIGLERNGDLVFVTGYNQFNGRSCHCHVYSLPGARLTRAYIGFCFYYPFVQCGLELVIGMTPSSFEAANKFNEHLGFKEVFRIQDAHPDGDIIIRVMKKHDCRFIRGDRYAIR